MYNNPVADSIELNIEAEQCIVCGKRTTFCCSRCRRVFYCSQTCQKVDWRSHKLICHEPLELPPENPPPVTTQLFSLPNASKMKPVLPVYDRASEAFKEALMARFGSIVSAYEWFESSASGFIDMAEFEATMKPQIQDPVILREFFTALDKSGKGRISLSEFLNEAAKKINPLLDSNRPSSPQTPNTPNAKPDSGVRPTDPSKLPAGRRALRQAALLAFRNGRYDDAIISSQQALGITSISLKSTQISAHPDNLVELLLLVRAFLVTKNFNKGDVLLEIIQAIIPLNTIEGFPYNHYPAHVTATLVCSIADVFDQYKKSAIAEKYFCKYLELVEDYFGPESLVYSDALTIVSAFYLRTGNLERAIETTELAKRIRQQNLPPVHARVADSVSNHGLVLKAAKRYDLAISEFEVARSQRVELFGINTLPVADMDYSIGSCYLNWAAVDGSSDRLAKAKSAMTLCHTTRLRLLGPSNDDTLNAADGLRKIQLVSNPATKKERVKIHDLYKLPEIKTPGDNSSMGANHDVAEEFDLNIRPLPPSGESSGLNTGRTFETKKSIPNEYSGRTTPFGSGQKSVPEEYDYEAKSVGISSSQSPVKAVSPAATALKDNVLKFPENLRFSDTSLFGQYIRDHGMDEFITRLSTLDTSLLEYIDFDIADALPKQLAPTPVPILSAMNLVYIKRMQELEQPADHNDALMLEKFFKQMKKNQESVRYVFSIMNTINRNLNGLTSPYLTLDTFSPFMHSQADNVDFMEYFANVLLREKPDVVDSILDDLVDIQSVVEIDLRDFLRGLQSEFKSVKKISEDFDLLQLPHVSDVSADANIVREAIQMAKKGTVIELKNKVERRVKVIAEGMSVLVEAFRIPQDKIIDHIDDAIDRFDEFYNLLAEHVEEDDVPDEPTSHN